VTNPSEVIYGLCRLVFARIIPQCSHIGLRLFITCICIVHLFSEWYGEVRRSRQSSPAFTAFIAFAASRMNQSWQCKGRIWSITTLDRPSKSRHPRYLVSLLVRNSRHFIPIRRGHASRVRSRYYHNQLRTCGGLSISSGLSHPSLQLHSNIHLYSVRCFYS
jgi:hypothetical protein